MSARPTAGRGGASERLRPTPTNTTTADIAGRQCRNSSTTPTRDRIVPEDQVHKTDQMENPNKRLERHTDVTRHRTLIWQWSSDDISSALTTFRSSLLGAFHKIRFFSG
ncbi:hypothetical protein BsWGS_17426 [Bradybaena similaris]